jgi:DNA-binding response OmpR family regulator
LAAYAEEFEWSVGEYWHRDDDGTFSLRACWHDGAPNLLNLLTLDATSYVGCDSGLVGGCFATGTAQFLPSVGSAFSPRRRIAVTEAGIESGLVYPLSGHGVICFLSGVAKPASEAPLQLDSIETVGRHLQLFFDHARPALATRRTTRGTNVANWSAILTLDANQFTLKGPKGQEHLSKTEWQLLRLLFEKQGTVVPHHTLMDSVWGSEGVADLTALHDAVSRIRKRFRAVGAPDTLIKSARGFGYELEL